MIMLNTPADKATIISLIKERGLIVEEGRELRAMLEYNYSFKDQERLLKLRDRYKEINKILREYKKAANK